MTDETPRVSAASRYHALTSERDHFLTRADKAARLTIPTLFQKDRASTRNMTIKDPHNSTGARGVNTLASKMVMALLPTNTAFFKLNVDELLAGREENDETRNFKTELLKGLGVIERQVLRDVENSGDATVVFEALKHLTVVGNTLLYIGEDATRQYNLNKYVVVRDPDGFWKEIVICEDMSTATLSDKLRAMVRTELQKDQKHSGKGSTGDTCTLYTHIMIENGRVKWHQELHDQIVPDSESEVPLEGSPWLPLRFIKVDGEDYGRSYIEMYMGDLQNLEVLTKAVTQAATAAAKVLYLIRPNGQTNPKVIAQAPNMAVRTGNADDVTVLRLDKAADMAVAKDMITTIERRMAYAFMISGEVMRDAERVTAEEVRYIAQELDDSLGGIYSVLSADFQLPYVKRRLFLMRRDGRSPSLPQSVKPVVVTGFAALGRGHDLDKLMRFLEAAERIDGLQSAAINKTEAVARVAVALGIETDGLILTTEQTAAADERSEMMGMIDNLGPEALRQLGGMVQTNMKGKPDGIPQDAAAAQG